MDERRLTELFHEAADSAAHQAPPATFDHADVLAGSRRAQARARGLQTGSIALAVLGLATAGVLSAGVLRTSSTPTTLAGPVPVTSPRVESAPGGEQPGGGAQSSGAQSGGAQSGGAQSGGGEQSGGGQAYGAAPFAERKRAGSDSCAVPDQRLFGQLADLVPAVRGATPRPLSDDTYCPSGGRGFAVEVSDGGAHGELRVLLSPRGTIGGGSSVQTGGGSMSTSTSSTRDGGSLSVTTMSHRGGAPYENRLDDLADKLASEN